MARVKANRGWFYQAESAQFSVGADESGTVELLTGIELQADNVLEGARGEYYVERMLIWINMLVNPTAADATDLQAFKLGGFRIGVAREELRTELEQNQLFTGLDGAERYDRILYEDYFNAYTVPLGIVLSVDNTAGNYSMVTAASAGGDDRYRSAIPPEVRHVDQSQRFSMTAEQALLLQWGPADPEDGDIWFIRHLTKMLIRERK